MTPYIPIAGGKASEAIAFYAKAFAAVATRYTWRAGRKLMRWSRLLSPLSFVFREIRLHLRLALYILWRAEHFL